MLKVGEADHDPGSTLDYVTPLTLWSIDNDSLNTQQLSCDDCF